ncbi:hypothetical protein FA13DRAFT_1521609 [Coprinellus micaceus]|uniref:Uncharacterized protein n=1 Tax=Coprinellus micaceus TaxID=71717 RepID=A0A4Y7SJV6_COPMI|nr:hypothetical protein FA13DRAFT_1521609 [Coprinellus micaceus]
MPVSRPSSVVKRCLCALLWAWSVSAYFLVTYPTRAAQWAQGTTHQLTWEKGLLDGVEGYDVELTRMSRDELVLVARNVPAKPPALNVYLDNLPAGDDYVFVFINSTHGVLQGTSARFEILGAGKGASSDQPTPTKVDNAFTASVTRGANPTAFFATTFPALPWNGAAPRPGIVGAGALLGVVMTVVGGVVGGWWVVV